MITWRHQTLLPDGSRTEHDGDPDGCPAPECQWPRLGSIVTAMGEPEITGSIEERTSESVRLCTPSGDWYFRPVGKVRRPDWGEYCPHGLKLIEAIPAEHDCGDRRGSSSSGCKACHPDGRKILPWPCGATGCTEADFDRGQQEEIEAYYESIQQSYDR